MGKAARFNPFAGWGQILKNIRVNGKNGPVFKGGASKQLSMVRSSKVYLNGKFHLENLDRQKALNRICDWTI